MIVQTPLTNAFHELPALEVQYDAIRHGVGISDRSDISLFEVRGEEAGEVVNRIVTGSIDNLPDDSLRHTLILNEDGSILSDIQVINLYECFWIVAPAFVGPEVLAVLREQAGADIEVVDRTGEMAVIAVEGPKAPGAAEKAAGTAVLGLPVLHTAEATVGDIALRIVRYGTCGEYGYLFFAPSASGEAVFRMIRQAAGEHLLCGKEVQHLLALEVRSFNLERDIPNGERPLEAGLHWMIHFRKDKFRGREALFRQKEEDLGRKLIALRSDSDAVPSGEVRLHGRPVGYIANSDYSPTLKQGIALAYLEPEVAWVGIQLSCDSTGGPEIPVRTVSSPFFQTRSTTS